jgi:DNA-directed RNA polymerase subunit RPC12/RpoP
MGNDSADRHDDFLEDRSGSDALSVTCVVIAAILIVLGIAFPGVRTGLNIFAILLLAYALWRISSKDVAARRAENEAFLKALGPVGRWTRSPKAEWKEARTYKHVRCSSCGQKIRVPRGKGHLRVTCPKCGQKFEVKA